mgnify:FL=1
MTQKSLNFGLIGAGGYIAPRHMKAIKETGNNLVAALDRYDGVGIMDSFFPAAEFFTEPEQFDQYMDFLYRRGKETQIDYLSICTPNYLHAAHMRMALRNHAHAICEKPLVLTPDEIEDLKNLEKETGKKIFTILQLRLHPSIMALKKEIDQAADKIYDINLQYITSRGKWYHASWKSDKNKSGGVATNIGIHFFDMLTWIFGDVKENNLKEHTHDYACGKLKLQKANVNWELSVNEKYLPIQAVSTGKRTYRSITVNGKEIEFSEGFTDLHTRSYEHILSGKGFGLEDARKSIEIVADIRNQAQ